MESRQESPQNSPKNSEEQLQPKPSILEFLDHKIQNGGFQIGQINVRSDFQLHHIEDSSLLPTLKIYTSPYDARLLALETSDGSYRPLKSAPNLRRGWLLKLQNTSEVRLALDFFYPAAIALWHSLNFGSLQIVPLRETLSRQTGMYRITQKITDQQAINLILNHCNNQSSCLRKILWPLTPERPHPLTVSDASHLTTTLPSNHIPILCIEACNLLIAAARSLLKSPDQTPK
ncbi:MAG: DR2241 family protein [Chthoniobacterales bacterium]|nr:DR2241 family protein [Chthoniobacterales bacterium]